MKTYLKFFKYFKNYIRPLLTANLFMILYILFNVISIALVMPFVDLLFKQVPAKKIISVPAFTFMNFKEFFQAKFAELLASHNHIEVLTYICILIFISFLLKNIFAFFQTYFMSTVEQGIVYEIQTGLYSHLHKLSLSFFTEEKKGNLISRIVNDVKIINDSMVAVINSIFRDPPQIVIFTIVLFLLNWKLTLFILILLPILAFVLSKIGNSIKRKSIQSQERISDVTSILDETLGGIRIVKAFNMQDYEVSKFQNEVKKYYRTLISLIRKRALASPITEMISILFVVSFLYFVGYGVLSGEDAMTPGQFVLYLGFIFQMMPSLKLFGQVFNSIKEGIAAGERVFSVLETKPKIQNAENAVEINNFNKSITFENVDFRYETGPLILNNLSLKINKGEIVAIVGPSGAGKSTLADLIPRFYDVTAGAIKIDDINIKNIKIESLLKLIGIVTQETFLFNDTIKNNISYGTDRFSQEEIEAAAKMANAHEFIVKMTNGYNTLIGDRGVKISGGQRQRLAIARALLKNPPILILDEATSALDTESEILVQNAIENLMRGRTSIVIAHRLSTIINAHKIVVIEKGKIVEQGKHSELLTKNGLYKKLYNLQFKGTR